MDDVWEIMYEGLVHIENMPGDIFDEDDQIRAIASQTLKRGKEFKNANQRDKSLLAFHRGLLFIAKHSVGISDAAQNMVKVAYTVLKNAEN